MAELYRKAVLACLILYWLALFTATHIRWQALPEEVTAPLPSDKSLHFVCYALLGILNALVIFSRIQENKSRLRVSAWVFGVVLPLYGLFDEATQPLFGRHFDWMDWAYDVMGVGLVGLVVIFILRFRL